MLPVCVPGRSGSCSAQVCIWPVKEVETQAFRCIHLARRRDDGGHLGGDNRRLGAPRRLYLQERCIWSDFVSLCFLLLLILINKQHRRRQPLRGVPKTTGSRPRMAPARGSLTDRGKSSSSSSSSSRPNSMSGASAKEGKEGRKMGSLSSVSQLGPSRPPAEACMASRLLADPCGSKRRSTSPLCPSRQSQNHRLERSGATQWEVLCQDGERRCEAHASSCCACEAG